MMLLVNDQRSVNFGDGTATCKDTKVVNTRFSVNVVNWVQVCAIIFYHEV